MGVEYSHGFYVPDLSRVYGVETARRVDDLLHRWELVSGPPKLFDLDGGRCRKVRAGLDRVTAPPANLLLRYGHVEGLPGIGRVMGPFEYESLPGEEYLSDITLIVGPDFRTLPVSEAWHVEVTAPPRRNREPVEQYPDRPGGPHEFFTSYPADTATEPPTARLEPGRPDLGQTVPGGFTGVWRAGLQIDCGKNLPAWAYHSTGSDPLPNREFVADLEVVFGTNVVELGYFD